MFYMILYPLRYFQLQNQTKRRMDQIPTLAIALLIALPYICFHGPSFFRPNGLLDKTLTLTSCLTGFYVAALVAAATFQHPDLDRVIRSGTIALVGKGMDGRPIQEALSRRQLSCYIFGYLSFLSLALSILCAFAIGMTSLDLKSLGTSLNSETIQWLRRIIIFGYSMMISHLFVTTNFGLYYLMDRLWRRDPTIKTEKRPEDYDNVA